MPNQPRVDEDQRTPLKQRILLWLVVGAIMVPLTRWYNEGAMNGDRAFLIIVLAAIGFLIAPIREPQANVIERTQDARPPHSDKPKS